MSRGFILPGRPFQQSLAWSVPRVALVVALAALASQLAAWMKRGSKNNPRTATMPLLAAATAGIRWSGTPARLLRRPGGFSFIFWALERPLRVVGVPGFAAPRKLRCHIMN